MARRRTSKSTDEPATLPAKAKAGASKAVSKFDGISPNPLTNLLITDLVLRGGAQIMRRAVERSVLGTKYPPGTAREIVKGRSMSRSLVRTALARLATRSVPGAIIVSGGLLAKTLYERKHTKRDKSED